MKIVTIQTYAIIQCDNCVLYLQLFSQSLLLLSNTIIITNTENTVYQSSCPVLVRGCLHHRKNPKSPSYAPWQNSQLVSGVTDKEEEKDLFLLTL